MKKVKNHLRRIKNILALTFFALSLICFVVQAADLPLCRDCDNKEMCEEGTGSSSSSNGWKDCDWIDADPPEIPTDECYLSDRGACSGGY